MLTVVKRRRFLTPVEKAAEKKAERDGHPSQKVGHAPRVHSGACQNIGPRSVCPQHCGAC